MPLEAYPIPKERGGEENCHRQSPARDLTGTMLQSAGSAGTQPPCPSTQTASPASDLSLQVLHRNQPCCS
ncbi:hypothetical protein SKAU_G00317870 [Synaphobranchus kaupii]|uniref:Uncharacterized protein n=1 Tax=Synaphobranchus kaupii TaxID=118154 RepID=A0A9Q1ILQ2_SYNKA|nr:hypothetical protein SKAU_G00317870 [Synaphobranchus kaupii]